MWQLLTIFNNSKLGEWLPPATLISLLPYSVGYRKMKTLVTECSTIIENLKIVLQF